MVHGPYCQRSQVLALRVPCDWPSAASSLSRHPFIEVVRRACWERPSCGVATTPDQERWQAWEDLRQLLALEQASLQALTVVPASQGLTADLTL